MKFWISFWTAFGLLMILTGIFHPHIWSQQWWDFFLGCIALGTAASLLFAKGDK